MTNWTLHNARCQDILPGEYAGEVDLIVTSPPYDALRSYGGHNDDFDFAAIAPALVATLKPGGVLVWVVADQVLDGGETLTSFRQAIAFQDLGLMMHQTMIYRRWSINGMSPNRYYREHEYMFVFSKGKPKTANMIVDRKNIKEGTNISKKSGGRSKDDSHYTARETYGLTQIPAKSKRGSIWSYAQNWTADQQLGGEGKMLSAHPAYFPRRLAEDHIRSWTDPGDLVLDPMCGSGTVLRAAENLRRRSVGVEVNPDYCALIRERMAQLVLT